VVGVARLKVDWNRKNTADVTPTLRRFERWLVENGYREACVETYVGAVRKFLGVAKSANPTLDDAMTWHGDLAESKLARSTVNICSAALKAFYRFRGLELTLPHMKMVCYLLSVQFLTSDARGVGIFLEFFLTTSVRYSLVAWFGSVAYSSHLSHNKTSLVETGVNCD
jgi:hypothetical protein